MRAPLRKGGKEGKTRPNTKKEEHAEFGYNNIHERTGDKSRVVFLSTATNHNFAPLARNCEFNFGDSIFLKFQGS